jgi:hypothetical protein
MNNSDNKKHTIKDMYVFISFDLKYKLIGKFRGFRTTFTPIEIYNSYTHSHLRTISINNCISMYENSNNDFCIGVGQPIELTLSELRNGFDADSFLSFCMQLETYLSWESKEGTPYIYYKTLVNQNKYVPYIHPNRKIEYTLSEYKNKYYEIIKNKYFDYHIYNNILKVTKIKDQPFINNFQKIYKDDKDNYFNLIDGNSNNREYRRGAENYAANTRDVFIHVYNNKNEVVHIKNKLDEPEQEVGYAEIPNPFLIKEFTESLEFLIN